MGLIYCHNCKPMLWSINAFLSQTGKSYEVDTGMRRCNCEPWRFRTCFPSRGIWPIQAFVLAILFAG